MRGTPLALRKRLLVECHSQAPKKKIGFVVKKNSAGREQEGLDIAQARGAWAEFQKTPDPNRLVFLDESGYSDRKSVV